MSAPRSGRRGSGRPGKRPDDAVLLWAFRGLLVAAFVVLGLDLADLQRQALPDAASAIPGLLPRDDPYLPSVRENVPGRPGASPPDVAAALRGAARFELVAGGRLLFEGAIEPGTAARFAAELERRGGYVRTVVLNSPGGSVADALAIAGMIRRHGFDTEIGPGSYCASSCPLVFAGGRARTAAPDAAIGVHRVFATGDLGGANLLEEAQRVSADCQRFLVEMGVDPRVWMHAMATPKDELFYFTPRELIDLKLATRIETAAR